MKKIFLLLLISVITIFSPVSLQANETSWEQKMGEIINSYLTIRSQLAADSLNGVKAEAEKISKNSESIQNIIDRTTHDTKLKRFYSQIDLNTIGKQAHMLQNPNIYAVRQNFEPLSKQIRKYLELFGKPKNVEGEVYIYHCGMYPGSWLQENKNVGNPYYGKKMLKCGKLMGETSKEKQHEQ